MVAGMCAHALLHLPCVVVKFGGAVKHLCRTRALAKVAHATRRVVDVVRVRGRLARAEVGAPRAAAARSRHGESAHSQRRAGPKEPRTEDRPKKKVLRARGRGKRA